MAKNTTKNRPRCAMSEACVEWFSLTYCDCVLFGNENV
ncbi:Uncharacterised protein [Burkholderia oklahomensis]|nr:hypothetical protein BG90_4590 [Burkholderia oklahomensis C6786]SUY27633.1 Uncharacterised protein [Burkholderia oklahomensis]